MWRSVIWPSNESQSSWELGRELAFLARYSNRTEEETDPPDSRTCRHTRPASWAERGTRMLSTDSLLLTERSKSSWSHHQSHAPSEQGQPVRDKDLLNINHLHTFSVIFNVIFIRLRKCVCETGCDHIIDKRSRRKSKRSKVCLNNLNYNIVHLAFLHSSLSCKNCDFIFKFVSKGEGFWSFHSNVTFCSYKWINN